jgi:hypothetical protein
MKVVQRVSILIHIPQLRRTAVTQYALDFGSIKRYQNINVRQFQTTAAVNDSNDPTRITVSAQKAASTEDASRFS